MPAFEVSMTNCRALILKELVAESGQQIIKRSDCTVARS